MRSSVPLVRQLPLADSVGEVQCVSVPLSMHWLDNCKIGHLFLFALLVENAGNASYLFFLKALHGSSDTWVVLRDGWCFRSPFTGRLVCDCVKALNK